MNEQIVTYVAGERARGVTDEAIRGALLAQGWKDENVSEVMTGILSTNQKREFSIGGLFEGRLSRWNYFVTSMIFLGCNILLLIVLGLGAFFFDEVFAYIMYATYIVTFPLGFSLSIRRIHDNDWSGWLVLVLLVPMLNFIFGLVLLFKKGTDGANTYGLPQTKRGFVNTLLNL